MARKKIIRVEEPNPFGDEFDEAVFQDPGRQSTWVPGYSDARRQRSLDLRDGKKPKTLKHRLQWARAKSLDGTRDDGMRVFHWSTKGYKTMRADDSKGLGYDFDFDEAGVSRANPAVRRGEDGNVYRGEYVLMFADAPTAAANWQRIQDAKKEQDARPRQMMEEAVDRFNRANVGASATHFAFASRSGDDPDETPKRGKKKQ